jgi:glucosamine--fructose-6-phosphate aminotransferase (isomerizing)
MCGIVGYVGAGDAYSALLEGLQNIAYRGYDSSGIALLGTDDAIRIFKTVGGPSKLKDDGLRTTANTVGIGHTRWATHGEPTDENAHPHYDCTEGVAVAHNGIIENYMTLRAELIDAGHVFASETDTEVIPHLIEHYLASGLAFDESVRAAANRLDGAYAFVALSNSNSRQIVGVREDCPLLAAVTSDGTALLASDLAAMINYSDEVIVLENGQMVIITDGEIRVRTLAGDPVEPHRIKVDLTAEKAQLDGYDHFMLKEIHEQPRAVRDLLHERLSPSGQVSLPELDDLLPEKIDQIVIAACGTASYAAAFGKVLIEELTGLPVLAEIGSEFRYRRHFLGENSLFVVISQSGETADTIAALRAAREAKVPVLGIVNVMGTSVAREADRVIYTRGGPESAVPSTKVFLNQLVVMELLALYLAERCGETENAQRVALALRRLPELLTEALHMEPDVKKLAGRYAKRQNWFVIGRGLDEALAREGALKMKEVAYIHAESIAAGELKHGPIALVDEGMPILALVTQPGVLSKMANSIQEIAARRGSIITLTTMRDAAIEQASKEILSIPSVSPLVDPIVSCVPLQLLSYYCGVNRGAEIDYPRNLAKSVTVE